MTPIDFVNLFLVRIATHFSVFLLQVTVVLWIFTPLDFFRRNRLLAKPTSRHASLKRQLAFTASSILVGALTALLIRYFYENGWTQLYKNVSDYGVWYFVVSISLYCLCFDLYFYLTHRLFHTNRFLKKFHEVHHEAEAPTILAIYHFHPVEAATYSAAHVLLIMLLPLHPLAATASILIIDLQNLIFHWGYEMAPRRLRQALPFATSSTFHFVHHQEFNFNYGYFTNTWDSIFKTKKQLVSDARK